MPVALWRRWRWVAYGQACQPFFCPPRRRRRKWQWRRRRVLHHLLLPSQWRHLLDQRHLAVPERPRRKQHQWWKIEFEFEPTTTPRGRGRGRAHRRKRRSTPPNHLLFRRFRIRWNIRQPTTPATTTTPLSTKVMVPPGVEITALLHVAAGIVFSCCFRTYRSSDVLLLCVIGTGRAHFWNSHRPLLVLGWEGCEHATLTLLSNATITTTTTTLCR